MKQLFRQEAIKYAFSPLAGEVIVSTPFYLRALTVVALVFTFGGLVFLATAQYPRQEAASGWITPRGGIVRVTGMQPGMVRRLYVEEGTVVSAGETLAEIDLLGRTAAGDTGQALEASFEAETDALTARSKADADSLSAQKAALETSISDLRSAVAQSSERADVARRQVEVSEREVERAKAIAERGFLSQRDLDQRTSNYLSIRNDQLETEAELLRLNRELNSARSQHGTLSAEIDASQADIRLSRAGVYQRRAQSRAQSVQVVSAPVSGTVAVLPVRTGQSIRQDTVLMALTPSGAPLEVELFVPSSAAGFIKPGQLVKLFYDAFPHQKFGAGQAEILSVSPTVLAPGEVPIPGAPESGQPMFRVRARLTGTNVHAYGQDVPLRAGMTLRANLVLERRTLIEWLLDPLYAAGRR